MTGRRDAGRRPSRTVRIGLTGPIGCGKSTVASWLAAAGAVTIDADGVAREVTAPGMPAHDAILARWGSAVESPDGTLDRSALAARVFADPAELAALEAIVHPAVRPAVIRRMDEAAAAGAPAVVVEAIKLVEGGLAALCDEVWLVVCGGTAQRTRLRARGLDDADAERRLAAQVGLVQRVRPVATRVIETSGAPEETAATVRDALRSALGRRLA